MAPKAFMSYSHDGTIHEKWVEKLAFDLMQHGVEVILDKWDLRLGADLPFFMEQGLSISHLVLCVCSEMYTEKADNMKGGVGYEKMIISSKFMSHANSEFIIPIIRNNPRKILPTIFQTKLYLDFSDDSKYYDSYKSLLFRIHGKDQSAKPQLGRNPFNNDLYKTVISETEMMSTLYYKNDFSGLITFLSDNNNGVFTIGAGDYCFIMHWYTVNKNAAHIRLQNGKFGYLSGCNEYPPNILRLNEFDFSSYDRRLAVNDVIMLVNQHGKVSTVRFLGAKSRTHGDNESEVTFEYSIYTV
jgi:hypothetical protein